MSQNNVFTVSALNRQIKAQLEGQFGRVWLTGEISNLATPASGHWYFTLKDDRSQLRCAMFRSRTQRVTFRPQHGMQVLVRANVTLYEPRGDMQLVVESMQPAGDGLLQQQFEALKMQLASEGLFSTEHKQPLPHPIQKLGIVTSASGAAIRDVLSVLKRRDPMLEVIIYPTLVQGKEATANICHAIEVANWRDEVDCLLLTRGGGSLEDIWCFNEEAVARAIFDSHLPIVSAVGHEVDTTISDYVADLRAPTPSAAAELLSQDAATRLDRLKRDKLRLVQATQVQVERQQQKVALLGARLQASHPARQLEQHAQRLDELTMNLQQRMALRLAHANQRQQQLAARFNRHHPAQHLAVLDKQLTSYQHRLGQALDRRMSEAELRLKATTGALEAVSPLAVLSRGYSILQDDKGNTIKTSDQVNVGDTLNGRLHKGQLALTVAAKAE